MLSLSEIFLTLEARNISRHIPSSLIKQIKSKYTGKQNNHNVFMHVYAICVIFLLNMWTVFSSQTTLTLCFEVGTTSGLGEQPAAIARARTGCLHRPDFHVYGIFEEYNSQPTDRAYIDSHRYLPRAQSAPARFLSFREH